MKKLSVIFVSFIILTISCEHDFVNEKNIEESATIEFSKLQLLVDSLGISEKYNLSTIVHNPDNKFEVVGILHNYGCDFLLEKMKNINFKKGFDYIKCSYEFAQTINIEIPNGLLETIPFDQMYSKGSFIDDENIKLLVEEGLFDENTKNLFIKLRDNVLKCSNLDEMQNTVLLLENEFLSDESLSELEKQNILSACAIIRYSSAYWASKGFNKSGKGWLKSLFIAACDTVGGLTGFGIAGLGGSIIIATMTSFGVWVLMQ